MSCEYLREFSKKFETTLMVYSGAWGKLIHEKNRSRKSRETVPLNKGHDSKDASYFLCSWSSQSFSSAEFVSQIGTYINDLQLLFTDHLINLDRVPGTEKHTFQILSVYAKSYSVALCRLYKKETLRTHTYIHS